MSQKSIKTFGTFLLFASFLLIVLGVSHFPSDFWEKENFKVRWYRREGLQNVNGQMQFSTGAYKPSDGEPTYDELKQLLSDMNFFSKFNVNQRIFTNVPEIENLRAELYTRGYRDLGMNLIAIEVVPQSSQIGITIGIIGIVVSSFIVLFANRKNISRKTAKRQKEVETRGMKMDRKGNPCPKCGNLSHANDRYCIKCGEKLP